MTGKFSYTQQDVKNAFLGLQKKLFDERVAVSDEESSPKMLVVAGIEGAGKTHLLNELLDTCRYSNYVPLYEPHFRTLHPQYQEIVKNGVGFAYNKTDQFVRDLGGMIFEKALREKYSIIMEVGLETYEFAEFQKGEHASRYQYEVHVIACKKDFAHVSTISRALDSAKNNKLERFVSLRELDAGMANAKAVLTAFEEACSKVKGSEIALYERSFGTDKNSKMICRSLCVDTGELVPQAVVIGGVSLPAASNKVSIEYKGGAAVASVYKAFADIADGAIFYRFGREKMVFECHSILSGVLEVDHKFAEPAVNGLYSYILKYAIR